MWRCRTKKQDAAIHLCGGGLGDPLAGAGLPSFLFGGGWAPLGLGLVGCFCETVIIVYLWFWRGFVFVVVLGLTPSLPLSKCVGILQCIRIDLLFELTFSTPTPSRPNYAQSCRRPFPHTFRYWSNQSNKTRAPLNVIRPYIYIYIYIYMHLIER